jgi:hypothetical protein
VLLSLFYGFTFYLYQMLNTFPIWICNSRALCGTSLLRSFWQYYFERYGSALPKIGFLSIKTILLAFYFSKIPKCYSVLVVFFVIYVLLILQNGISEYFWNEFGVRYNFIAVNYLIYTNEVIGNILESYP